MRCLVNDTELKELYLTLIPTGDIESLKKIQSSWTESLISYYHPLNLVSKDITILPFYSPVLKDKYKGVYEDILYKRIKFQYDFVSEEKKYHFHKESNEYKKGVFYKLPCKEYRQVVVKQDKFYKPVSNIELPQALIPGLCKKLPVKVYLIGLQCIKGLYWYQYITEDEMRNRKIEDSFNERVIFTRNLLKRINKKMMPLEGQYLERPLGKSLYSDGDFFKVKIVGE